MLALCWHAHTLAAFRVATSRVETKKTLPLQTTPTLSLRVKHKFELSISNITLHYITTSLTSISFFCLDFDRNTHGLVCLHFWLKTQKHLCFVASLLPALSALVSCQIKLFKQHLNWVGLGWVELSWVACGFHSMPWLTPGATLLPINSVSFLSPFSLFLVYFLYYMLGSF